METTIIITISVYENNLILWKNVELSFKKFKILNLSLSEYPYYLLCCSK